MQHEKQPYYVGMSRVPSARLDPKVVKQYCRMRTGRARGRPSVATVTTVGAHLVIDLRSEDESGEDWEDPEPGLLSALVAIRNELMAGDYRALYLAWRLRVFPCRACLNGFFE